MENLEKEIISRLNKVLIKYDLAIVFKNNHIYKTTIDVDDAFKDYCKKYVLVEIENNTIIGYCYSWETVKCVLLESTYTQTLFNVIDGIQHAIKYYTDENIEPPDVHMLLSKLYNELMFLSNCNSYEELIIKMDLIGI